eukprot:6994578-Prymnesium_polylepis.1
MHDLLGVRGVSFSFTIYARHRVNAAAAPTGFHRCASYLPGTELCVSAPRASARRPPYVVTTFRHVVRRRPAE